MQSATAYGASIPVLGFGTWNLNGESAAHAVTEAIGIGYRHIDTAAGYRNEDRVGEGIRASGVPRDQLFITTKVSPENLEDKAFKGSVERSLKLLDIDQLDLVLIHWPNNAVGVARSIASLNAVKQAGWTKHIGVSNHPIKLLEQAWAVTKEPIVTNQCEYHPYLDQTKLLAACRTRKMIFTAYSPLGRRAVLNDPVIVDIAKKKGKSRAQVVLRWDIQQDGIITIPKSSQAANIRANFDIFGFSLDASEMAAISALAKSHHTRVADPGAGGPEWD